MKAGFVALAGLLVLLYLASRKVTTQTSVTLDYLEGAVKKTYVATTDKGQLTNEIPNQWMRSPAEWLKILQNSGYVVSRIDDPETHYTIWAPAEAGYIFQQSQLDQFFSTQSFGIGGYQDTVDDESAWLTV